MNVLVVRVPMMIAIGVGRSGTISRLKMCAPMVGRVSASVMIGIAKTMTKKPLTDFQARALATLLRHGPMRPAIFAEYMWPDSPMWEKGYKVGRKANGAVKGWGLVKSGASHLGKLVKHGLALSVGHHGRGNTGWTTYEISGAGRRALEAWCDSRGVSDDAD